MYYGWSTLKKLIYLVRQIAKKVIGVLTYVEGTSPPIRLESAINSDLVMLRQYGNCAQESTPTPSAPVPIMCNNGELRMVDDELPSGYTRLSYIESDGTSGSSGSNGFVDTGIILNSLDLDVEIDFQLTDTYASSPRMAWGYMGTPSSLPRWGFGAYSSKWLGSPNATASAGALDTDRHVAVMRVYVNSSDVAMYSGTLDGEALYNANNLGNVSLFEGNDEWSAYLFARNNNNTAGNFAACKIFRFKVYKADALTHDLVPCKNGNGALGFYDLVTATFSGASGTLIAGAADYSHAHVGTDGTPEQIYVGGKNLNAGEITHQGYDSNGNIITSNNLAGTLTKIPVRYDRTVTVAVGVVNPVIYVSWDGLTNGRYAYVNQWFKDGTFFQGGGYTNGEDITLDKDVEYINVAVYDQRTDGVEITEDAWIQVEYSRRSATAYQPYTGGTYVNAVDLLGIPNVVAGQDSHNIITGEVHRNVGIKVFDGSESVSASGAGWAIGIADKIKSKVAMLCTHYPYSSATMANAPDKSIIAFSSQNIGIKDSALTSATAVKDWLAEQYASGTPVIVIYQLSDTQISHVDPQTITIPEGEDVVYWAASVKDKRMTAQYYKLSNNAVGSAIVGTATAG